MRISCKTAEAFREAGHDLTHVGLSAGETVHGKKEQTPVTIDQAVSDVTVDEFDALFIPGGYSPDKLRAHDAPVEFVREFVESGKPVLLICHAPQLLITAKVLEGRKITGWRSVAQDIRNAGADTSTGRWCRRQPDIEQEPGRHPGVHHGIP